MSEGWGLLKVEVVEIVKVVEVVEVVEVEVVEVLDVVSCYNHTTPQRPQLQRKKSNVR